MESLERKQNRNDLLVGSVIKKLIAFFLPIAAGTLFQQLYNAVDAFVVSKYVGTTALAAVGGSPAIISNLVIGFCVALTAGCSVVIAQYFGSERNKEIRDAVKTAYLFSVILGLFVGVIIIALSPQILKVLKTTDETFDDSLLYQRIYFGGAIFMLVYNMGAGILRAVGDAKFPFIALFTGAVLNIALDFAFVLGCKWGVAGAAWATLISVGVSALMVSVKLFTTKKVCRLHLKSAKFSLKILKSMLKIGIPSGLQSAMYGFSNLILQIGVNSLGTITVASWAMSGKVDGVFWAITNAFGTAVTTFVGQNFGAGYFDRIKECSKKGFITLLIITVCTSGVLLGLGKFIISILTDDAEVIDTTYKIMTYFVPFYFLWSVIESFTGVLRGVGDTLMPSIIQAVGICVLRIVWVYTIFHFYHTLFMLALSYLVSWAVTDIFILIYYFKKGRKVFNIVQNNTDLTNI